MLYYMTFGSKWPFGIKKILDVSFFETYVQTSLFCATNESCHKNIYFFKILVKTSFDN